MKPFCFLLLIHSIPLLANWEPPQTPNVVNILNSINVDRENGRYHDALLKHIWLDDHASLYQDSFYGNRFAAMMIWHRLNQVYPPSKELFEARVWAARTNIINDDPCCPEAFGSFLAYNRSNRNEIAIVELFEFLDVHRPALASKHFMSAKKSLFRIKKYDLIMKYIDLELEIDELRNHFEPYKEHSSDYSNDFALQKIAVGVFKERAATLVALLATNDRLTDATRVYDEVLEIYDNEHFRIELNKALDRVLPQ